MKQTKLIALFLALVLMFGLAACGSAGAGCTAAAVVWAAVWAAVVCAAIGHHDSKAEVDGPMDEILKDADVIDHSLSDPAKEVKPHEVARYAKLRGKSVILPLVNTLTR